MDRIEFLKNSCKYGLCACMGVSFLTGSEIFASSKSIKSESAPDWQVDFMQNRYKDLLNILITTVDEKTMITILNQLGSKCGDDFANKYKNNPEGFFNFIKGLWADTVEYDKDKGIIKVNEKKRENCNCPFIRGKEEFLKFYVIVHWAHKKGYMKVYSAEKLM